ncbi:MAG: holo-ACP synthase [Pseudomonadota bacterium]
MIYGIGTDVVEVSRIQATYERFGDHFSSRLLLPEEYAAFTRYKRKVRFLAMRFAAKEALVKAMGTGFANGMWIRDVGIVSDPKGKPLVIFSERGDTLRRELGIGESHVSLTDEAGLVVAMAIMERALTDEGGRSA